MLYANDINWETSRSTSHLETQTNNNNNDDNFDDNIIKLKLKKPKSWNWELTTSKSSPNIAFPRILLYNDRGDLLADANNADCIFKGESQADFHGKSTRKSGKKRTSSTSTESKRQSSSSSLKSTTAKKERRPSSISDLKEIDECLDNFVDQLKTNGIDYKFRRHHSISNGNIYVSPSTDDSRTFELYGQIEHNERKLKRYASSIALKSTDSECCRPNTNKTNEDIVEASQNPNSVHQSLVRNNNGNGHDVDNNDNYNDGDNDNDVEGDDVGNDKLENLLDYEPEISDNVPKVPIWVYSEKGLLQRDWNSKEFDHTRKSYKRNQTSDLEVIHERAGTSCIDLCSTNNTNNKQSGQQIKEVRFNLQKSKSAIEIPDKKKSRRPSVSCGPSKFSGSILERMSAFKKMSSSTDSQDIETTTIPDRPRYFLRTSKAGTLVVCEENYRNRKVRRRPKGFQRVPEIEENDNNCNRSKVVQKFIYPGNEEKSPIHENETYYDSVIENIDNLISKVCLKSELNPPTFSNSQQISENEYDHFRSNQVQINGDGYVDAEGSPKNMTKVKKPRPNQNGQFSLASYGLMAKNLSPLVNKTTTSKFLTVEKPNDPREQSVASDFKVKRRKKLKDLRRCVSAGTVCQNLSSDEENLNLDLRTARIRGKRKTQSRDELLFEQPEQKSCRETVKNGDQILTLNNNLTAVQSVGSAPDIIDGTCDEVLLRFVQRLASLTQQQQQQKHNQHQFNGSNLTESILIEEKAKTNSFIKDENRNYKADKLNNVEKDPSENDFEDQTFFNENENSYLETIKSPRNIEENQSLHGKEKPFEEDNNIKFHQNKQFYQQLLLNDQNDNSDKRIVQNSVKLYSGEENPSKTNDCGIIKETSELNNFVNSNHLYSNEYVNYFKNNSKKFSNNNCSAIGDENDRDNLNSDLYCGTHVPLFGSECDQENYNFVTNMGSNVSRNSGKGLSGRRTQSSGNLYNDKHHQNGSCHSSNRNPGRGKHSTMPSSNNENLLNGSCRVKRKGGANTLDRADVLDYPSESCPSKLMSPLCGVTKRDRNKFCGSLPNHLDNDDNNIDVIENDTSIPNNHIHTDNSEVVADRVEYVTVVAPRRQQAHHQQQHSPYNNSVSEKETASTSSGSSTFKINQDKPDIQLKLPLTRSNFDPSCDQGYGSERSPEDEMPPPMPNMAPTPSPYQPGQNSIDWDYDKYNEYTYNFITKDCTFCVQITKGPRGLGLSISGGIDSNAAFPGLIRIKRLFPHQAAWSTGKLQPGDIILEVNGVPITGLTNYDALEVLRTMPNDVVLLICRPNDEQYKKLSPPTEPPKPPQRTQQQATQTLPDTYPLQPLTPIQTSFSGEFEIIMVKQQGSLGFTLRKEDESVLGHYVRALVREPATTDGRIKPGDKIVAVNDVPLSPMTHEQAVIFLRQAADTVKLRLYRDEAQTPVAAMSPTSSENKTICGTLKKPFLRPEAINLLSDLAYKKQIPQGDSTESSVKSNNTSPRRLRRGTKAQHSNSGNTSQSEQDTTDSKSSSNPQYLVCSQTTSVCSDSEQSMASQCSYIVQPADHGNTDELFRMMPSDDNGERPDRPSFLDLAGQSGSTPVVSRKPRFQFTVAANAYDLNNLDNDALDAPIIYTSNSDGEHHNLHHRPSQTQLPENHEFTSLPCETFLIACKTESDLKNEASFSHLNPMYQSAHAQVLSTQNDNSYQTITMKKDGNKSLLKWKGIVFSPDEEDEKETPEADSSCAATAGTYPTPGSERDFDLKEFSSSSSSTTNAEGHKIISVELNRGWNSRLGFSLQPDPNSGKTIIRAIYSDSVAAKDGRLKVGDLLLTVNDESVENMPTSEIIDLLRIIRGSIAITVLRRDVAKHQQSYQSEQESQ